jgi:hypothetical protein
MDKISKLARFLQESDWIEGVHHTIEEYEAALGNAYPLEEGNLDYVSNHVYALIYACKNREVAPGIVHCLELHRRLMAGTSLRTEQIGNFRTIPVQVGSHLPPRPEILIYHLEGWQQTVSDKISDPWKNHVLFEDIHPFVDGNGRVGRLLWAWDQFRRGESVGPFLEHHFGDIKKYLDAEALDYFQKNNLDINKLRKGLYFASLNKDGIKPVLGIKHLEKLFC